MQLRPAGLPPIDAVVDYRTDAFLGLRTDDALIRVYGRDAFGWPVGVALHLFAPDADGAGPGAGVARLAGRRLRDRGERGLMPQYAVMIFERELPGGVADIPPEVLAAHGALPERIREAGGRDGRGAGAGADRHGDHDPPGRADRRPVHRGEGGARTASS